MAPQAHPRLADLPWGLFFNYAYFHIQIAPHHNPFLRFTFEGVACQYTALPLYIASAYHLYEMRGCSSLPTKVKGSLLPELH